MTPEILAWGKVIIQFLNQSWILDNKGIQSLYI